MFKYKKNSFTLPVLLITFIMSGVTQSCRKPSTRIQIPAHHEPANIMRFEQDLFSVDTNNLDAALATLRNKYGIFYLSFAHDLLAFKEDREDTLFIKPMKMVLSYKPFRVLQQTVDSAYGDISDIADRLGLANAIIQQEFPSWTPPSYVTFISEYSYANVSYEKLIGIGLDMYMNNRLSKFYRALEFPEFMIRKLRREYIVPNTIKSLGLSAFDGQTTKDKRFISSAIFEGKIRYFMQALLPATPDSLIMGYTQKQMEWCYENEGEVWAHYVEKDLLYKDNPSEFMRYFNDGPFTTADGVPAESAPAIAIFTGWQIVKSYMNKNPDVSLQQLMNERDFDKILKLSKYKP